MKIDLIIQESNNFVKIFDSINILSESQILIEELDISKLKDRFINFINMIIDKLKEFKKFIIYFAKEKIFNRFFTNKDKLLNKIKNLNPDDIDDSIVEKISKNNQRLIQSSNIQEANNNLTKCIMIDFKDQDGLNDTLEDHGLTCDLFEDFQVYEKSNSVTNTIDKLNSYFIPQGKDLLKQILSIKPIEFTEKQATKRDIIEINKYQDIYSQAHDATKFIYDLQRNIDKMVNSLEKLKDSSYFTLGASSNSGNILNQNLMTLKIKFISILLNCFKGIEKSAKKNMELVHKLLVVSEENLILLGASVPQV